MKTLHIIATLHRGGIEKLVLAMGDAGLSDEMAVCSLGGSGPLAEEFTKSGVRVLACPYQSPHIDRFVLSLSRLIRQLQPDIVHSHVGSFTIWVALASRMAGVKRIVSTYHSTYTYRPAWRHQMYLSLAQRLIRAHVGVSQTVCRWFADTYGIKNMRCIYNGIPLVPNSTHEARQRARRALGIPVEAFVVGAVGNFTPAKDYPTFFEVAREVIQHSGQPLLFLVIGDGLGRIDAEQRIDLLQLRPWTRLLGARDDVPALLPAMDVFLSTSTREGFALSIIEAQAAGLPVVASRIAPNQEAVAEGRSAVLATPGVVTEYAELVISLMHHPKIAHEMGRAGRDRVLQEFSITRTVCSYREIYNGIA